MWKQTLDSKEEQRLMEEFLETYKRLPALWDKQCKDYVDRKVKSRQYSILVSKYRKLYPKAQRSDVVKKINSLRTNYRKEYKKVQECAQKGEMRVPSLWYYNLFSFLHDSEDNDNNECKHDFETASQKDFETMSQSIIESRSPSTEASLQIGSPEFHKEYTILEEDANDIGSQNNIPLASNSKSSEKIEYKTQVLDRSGMRRRNMDRLIAWQRSQRSQRAESMKLEDYQQIAMVWGLELSKMQPRQQIYAKKAINEILYEGQLGNLHSDAVYINKQKSPSSSHEDPLEEVNIGS